MEALPDETIPPAARRLNFVEDASYRESLERDLAAVERHLRDEEWKGTMVIGTSVAEAHLLDAIKSRNMKDIDAAREALEHKKDGVKVPAK